MRFEGRVALVTGGGRGIGAETCRVLHSGGATVIACDMDAEPAQEVAVELGDRALGLAVDVTERAQVEAAVGQAVERFGKLDYLVCCAGITRDNLIYKMSDDDWDGVIDTHLKGSFLCCQAAQKAMVPNGFGRIVLLSSVSALGNRGQTNYSTAKAGLQGMARTLAIELGRYGINVNTVAPGFVETRMTQATAERMGVGWEEFKKGVIEHTPNRHLGQPADIANVIAFLLSDDGTYISGQTLYVRGGP
ncbi:MAG: SDR family oxidoreductase [Candidatus Dormibacteraeota bacterium]|nr:SDR family oxidoreductase [Candidatus Dormibacteraeota bacterium]